MIIFVVGGASSGKSAYAEALAVKCALPRYYLATMQVYDAESTARVERHRALRADKQFETVERSLNLGGLTLPGRGTVLLEDLGNLAANELYAPEGAGINESAVRAIVAGVRHLAQQSEHLIIVGNEVFSGGADYVGDTDRYLQVLAQASNEIAAVADAVCRVTCGVPVYYKGGEQA